MEIILVLSNENGKNVLFVLDNLQALSLEEVIEEIKKGEITGVHAVKATGGTYIRSNPNATAVDNLDFISIPLSAMTRISLEEKTAGVKKYYQKRQQFLRQQEGKGKKVVYIDGQRKKTEGEIIKYLSGYKKFVLPAAENLKVNKYLLGAILIDEDLRKDWVDDWFDWFAKLGRDTSVGIAQVKISTAKELIRRGFYNPNPQDKKLSPEKINKLPNGDIYEYLNDPKHSICFAAAKINQINTDFSSKYDIKKPEIIADLYSGTRPLSFATATERGKQIASEFYAIARKALK